MNWFEADQYCKGLGGNLASFGTNESFNKVSIGQNLSNAGYRIFWIGLNSINNGSYEWSDGSLANFTNWDKDQPDNYRGAEKCTEINSDGFWSDANCYIGSRGWVCKIRKDLTPTVALVNVNQTFPGT